ncbi:hypothetical protein I6E68_02680 [Salinibacterium sp. NSLL150]|uniref:hypothetical protein n=1 Tax=unclassified Salinibacterium TaxID=2632331 RepID=UPI0018CEBC53|nr:MULTISPECIES: hypothetical protein [unclassified Salinibacterium]MBH0098043.1 hypothetical protein [Salinibacterium sp. NSLL35]MBH0100798.1 hypothetical protein [Salinibacterium sp. NSLL150]MBH0103557.1 hypothetical protein [Salinibacterium sp. NSLL16]MBH0106318.1 hypothetical protein [Salinibacterium sp. NSLL17]MBH0109909.1 hypothetical protein [Salinibacterium sp. NG22]
MTRTAARRRRWPWIVLAVVVVLLVPIAIIVVPILTHESAGQSSQQLVDGEWPLSVTAEGDDGRTRTLSLAGENGEPIDTEALVRDERVVVTGTGYDGTQGVYVAVCVIPETPADKPGPCIGGVPSQQQENVAEGTVQWAPSNWINADWAWRLFGARSYDDTATGTFTAYLELGDPLGEDADCITNECGIFTRNDHTALNDRVQDVYVPVKFTE